MSVPVCLVRLRLYFASFLSSSQRVRQLHPSVLWLLLGCCSLYLEIKVGCGRLRLTSSIIAKPSTRASDRCKDFGDICCTSRGIAHFVLTFVAMATRVGRGRGWWPISENSSTDAKNLAHISYTSWVIANFVLNFVVMATGVEREKMQLAAFDGSSSKTPQWAQKISPKSFTQAKL